MGHLLSEDKPIWGLSSGYNPLKNLFLSEPLKSPVRESAGRLEAFVRLGDFYDEFPRPFNYLSEIWAGIKDGTNSSASRYVYDHRDNEYPIQRTYFNFCTELRSLLCEIDVETKWVVSDIAIHPERYSSASLRGGVPNTTGFGGVVYSGYGDSSDEDNESHIDSGNARPTDKDAEKETDDRRGHKRDYSADKEDVADEEMKKGSTNNDSSSGDATSYFWSFISSGSSMLGGSGTESAANNGPPANAAVSTRDKARRSRPNFKQRESEWMEERKQLQSKIKELEIRRVQLEARVHSLENLEKS